MMQLVVFVKKMTILHTGSKCKDQIKELNNIYCGEFVIICQECSVRFTCHSKHVLKNIHVPHG